MVVTELQILQADAAAHNATEVGFTANDLNVSLIQLGAAIKGLR
jgi:hypothetical protein